MIATLKKYLPRLSDWILIAPQQIPVTLYKLSLVSLAGVVGYRLDRSLFPYARPDDVTDLPQTAAMVHRA